MATTYIIAPQPWFIFNDKYGKPMVGGKIYTYDSLTRDPKATYSDAGGVNEQEWPIELDSAGMTESPIYWKLDGVSGYFVEVYNAQGDLERSIDNFPLSIGGGGGGPINEYFEAINHIQNIDFKFAFDVFSAGVPQGNNAIAPGSWFFYKSDNVATDQLNFNRIPLGQSIPDFNPEYEAVYSATGFSGTETSKYIYVKIANVKSFSNEEITLDFWCYGSSPATGEIIVVQNFGTGGSPSTPIITLTPFTFPSPSYGHITQTITVNAVTTESLGTNGDDYIAIGIQYPLTTVGNFGLTLFTLYRGALISPNGAMDTPGETFYKCIEDVNPDLTGMLISFFVDYGVINSTTRKYAIPGYLGMEDQTIGNVGSSAVERGAIYKNLFIYLWQSTTDANCPVSTGRGPNALEDWNLNKSIRLPLTMGRVIGNSGQGNGLSLRSNAQFLGEELHQLTVPEMPSHSHQMPAFATVPGGNPAPPYLGTDGAVGTLFYPTIGTGGDVPHNTMQPTVFAYYYIKY